MTADDYAKSILAIVTWREARGEGPDGMRAVAHVLRNRAYAWYKGDFVRAAIAKNQFSSMTVAGDSQTVLWPDGSPACDPLFHIIEEVFSPTPPQPLPADPTNGSLYYANERTITSQWYRDNIINSPDHPIKATIGNHTFRA